MRKKLKELSDIEQYSQRVDWCKQKYKYISKGSARRVYHYSDTLVLKLAYNEKGIAQNQAEVDIWRYAFPNQRKVLAAIVDYCPYGTWVLQKKIIKKLRPYYNPSRNFLKKKKAIFQSLSSDLDLHEGDNKKSLGTSSKGIVLFDYGFTKSVVKNYY